MNLERDAMIRDHVADESDLLDDVAAAERGENVGVEELSWAQLGPTARELPLPREHALRVCPSRDEHEAALDDEGRRCADGTRRAPHGKRGQDAHLICRERAAAVSNRTRPAVGVTWHAHGGPELHQRFVERTRLIGRL